MQIDITNGTVSAVTQTLTAASGYSLPSEIVASGATASYNSSTGVLTLTNLGETVYIDIPAISSFTSTEISSDDDYIYLTIEGTTYKLDKATPVTPYLTFSSPNTFTIYQYARTKTWDGTMEYSTDAETWNIWDGTNVLTAALHNGSYCLYFRGIGNTVVTNGYYDYEDEDASWDLNGTDISCIGNIEMLLDYQTAASGQHPPMANMCYYGLFMNNGSLILAPELPATTLANYCYAYMFQGCTSLTATPSLPATTMAFWCYAYMFYDCSSLATAPSLPATTLATYCYYFMFHGCSSLTTAPSLPATTLANVCYASMFSGCSSLATAPSLPATTLLGNCYNSMFVNCSSLTTPAIMGDGTTQLNAETYCCYYMYSGCTSLDLYTTLVNHTPFYKAMTYSTYSTDTNYRSTDHMFYNCKIDGTTSTTAYITAGTQLCYAEPGAQASGHNGTIGLFALTGDMLSGGGVAN